MTKTETRHRRAPALIVALVATLTACEPMAAVDPTRTHIPGTEVEAPIGSVHITASPATFDRRLTIMYRHSDGSLAAIRDEVPAGTVVAISRTFHAGRTALIANGTDCGEFEVLPDAVTDVVLLLDGGCSLEETGTHGPDVTHEVFDAGVVSGFAPPRSIVTLQPSDAAGPG